MASNRSSKSAPTTPPAHAAATVEARLRLEVLEAVAANEAITQRRLAERLGIALGLTNLWINRLAHKGYIKCVNVQSNRLRYLITPRGIAEKTRLTYEYVEYSLYLYRQVRNHLRTVLRPLERSGRRVAIYGAGEPAELAYLTLKEVGLEPAAVFDGEGGWQFLGMPVRDVREQHLVDYDLLIVATFDNPQRVLKQLMELGVSPEKLLPLRPDLSRESKKRGGAN